MGDIQLSVPTNQSQQLIEDVTFFIDIAYKDQPVFSRRFEGCSDLPRCSRRTRWSSALLTSRWAALSHGVWPCSTG